jgi:hypothetical protein
MSDNMAWEIFADHLYELSLDGSWPTAGDVEVGDGHAVLMIDPVDFDAWPDIQGHAAYIIKQNNYGQRDIMCFDTAEEAQKVFDDWDNECLPPPPEEIFIV